jgi:hypothetical protein
MKRIDYVLYIANQYCRAYVGEPYRPSAGHVFDYASVLKTLGISAKDFCGAGSMRLFDKKLKDDYVGTQFPDDVVKNAIIREIKAKIQKQK